MRQRHYILAQDAGANVAVANGQAALWDPDAGGGETFGVASASADGQEPRSHAICNTLIDPDWPTDPIPTLLAFYANVFYDGYRITEANATDGALLTGTVERYNATLQTWLVVGTGQIEAVALADMGLQRIISEAMEEPGEAPEPEAWVQPTGAHDAYSLGDEVSHNGKNWRSTYDGANVWEPGGVGTEALWEEV